MLIRECCLTGSKQFYPQYPKGQRDTGNFIKRRPRVKWDHVYSRNEWKGKGRRSRKREGVERGGASVLSMWNPDCDKESLLRCNNGVDIMPFYCSFMSNRYKVSTENRMRRGKRQYLCTKRFFVMQRGHTCFSQFIFGNNSSNISRNVNNK